MKLKFKNGGIMKFQPGGSVWSQISNPRQTYTDGYGVERPVNESKAITIGRNVYNVLDKFFNGPSEEWYNERGMSKPNTSLGVAGLINPAGETATLTKALSKMSASERAAMQQAFKDMQSAKMPIYDEALVMRLPKREPLYNPSTSSGISEASGRVLGRTTRGTMGKSDLMEPSYGSIGRRLTQREINQQKIDFLQKRIDEYNRYAKESTSAWSEMYKKWALEAEQQMKELLSWMR